MIPELEKYMTVKEVSEHFRVTDSTLRQWVRGGTFPNARRMGKSWLIPLSDVVIHTKRLYGGEDEV